MLYILSDMAYSRMFNVFTSFCRKKPGFNKRPTVDVFKCVLRHKPFKKHCSKTVVPSVLNATDFKREYDRDSGFVHTGVDRG
jgi:hypothetical protein